MSHTGCQQEQQDRDAAASIVEDLTNIKNDLNADLLAVSSLLEDAEAALETLEQELADCLVHSP